MLNPQPPSSSSPSSSLSSILDLEGIYSLFTRPSYCPAALRHLPPPIPNDFQPGRHEAVFTFEDAFEDLLVASQGKPLPDLDTRHDQRQLLRKMFPTGEPTWFFMRRLISQDLMPGLDSNGGFSHTLGDLDGFSRDISRLAGEIWHGLVGGHGDDKAATDGLFGDVAAAIRNLGSVYPKEQNSNKQDHARTGTDDKQVARELEPLEDIFSCVASLFPNGPSSWDAFTKAIFDSGSTAAIPQKQQQQQQEHKDLKRVVTRDEHVDNFGYRHTTVTESTLDASGNEVGRKVVSTVRPAESSEHGQTDADEVTFSKDSTSDSKDHKPGFFWAKK